MIQLNELKNYLGTGLKFCSELDLIEGDQDYRIEWTFDGVSKLFGGYCLNTLENSDAYPMEKCKLLVYPLSMLTEEIEHPVTGEKFVPVLELVKLITQNGFNVDNVSQVYFDDIQKVVTVVFESFKHPNSDLVVTRMFEIDTDEVSFSILTMDSENNVNYYLTGNIFEMYQKLFEWHFDVFDWIGKGSAINKKETK